MQMCVTTLFMANTYRPAKLRREKISKGMYFFKLAQFPGFAPKAKELKQKKNLESYVYRINEYFSFN